MRIFRVAMGFSVLLGCGASTAVNVAGGSDAAVVDAPTPVDVGTTHGEVRADCAPNDGPALTFIINAATPTCGADPGDSAQFTLTYWVPVPSGPGTFSVGGGEFSSGSSGRWCAGGLCQPATSGRFTLTSYSSTTGDIAGSVMLILRDGTTRSASFDGLIRCPGIVGCG